ncbi:hypothetical protein DFH28DRAFT_1166735 [Melampsora americana]|nr:hypothetical protein DFH28DRAFT_1166735 [Melampsora americana]
MANSSSIPPADIPLTGHMSNLFELPDERVGDDQGATSIGQNPLHRPGTPACIQFDLKNQMSIEVRFKIYTPTAVDIPMPSQSTNKVGAGKKPAKSTKLNLLNSRKIKSKYFEINSCFFGKSLNEFKTIVADACENFQTGMKIIILNRDFMPELKWKANVGRLKQVLKSVVQWQAFVSALEKSIKKHGVVQSAIEKLIEQTNGGGEKNHESKMPSYTSWQTKSLAKLVLVATLVATVRFLSVPWDLTFCYRLTYTVGWIWAKGVMANIATQHLPPNTQEFNQEIKKTVKGTSMGVSTPARQSTRVNKSSEIDSKPDLKKPTSKQIIDLTKLSDEKPILKKHTDKCIITDFFKPIESNPDLKKVKIEESKPDLKKINIENFFFIYVLEPGNLIDDPMYLLSDTESHVSDSKIEESTIHEGTKTNEIKVEDSKIDPTKFDQSNDKESEVNIEILPTYHSVEMELFLVGCKILYEDDPTCSILKEAGFISWTDLLPSVQMTETTLTCKGIDCQIASRLMEEAKARYYTNCKFSY